MKSNTIRCAALGAALATFGLAGAQGTLNTITIDKAGPGVAININGSNLNKPTEKWTADGRTLTLEFVGTRLPKWFPAKAVRDDGVEAVSVQRLKTSPQKVRVYIKVDGKSVARTVETSNGWSIQINKPSNKVIEASAKPKDDRSVPPLEPASKILAKKTAPVTDTMKTENSAFTRVKVSLDFVNTEVVQVLKAITMQAGVNIVTSPDVKGQVTVALDNVTVKQALDMVTTVSGLKYQQFGNSFIVSTPKQYNTISTQLGGKQSTMLDTRVVPIMSGQGPQIRASILSAMMDDPSFGQVQMFLPDENYKLEKKKEEGVDGSSKASTDVSIEKGDQNSPAASSGGEDAQNKPASLKGLKDQYMVLVGPGDLTEEIAERIANLDEQITKSHGYDYSKDSKLVRKSYRVQSPDVTANSLVEAFSKHSDKALINVDMFATPPLFQNQVVVLVGREGEVSRAEGMLKDLDYSGYGSDVFVYDVKYADPRGLREELVAHVKGLRATIPTASAANVRVWTPGQSVANAQQESRHTGMVQLDANNQVASKVDPATGKSDAKNENIDSPFKGMEPVAVPMRLTLTGTPEQIDEAKAYLEQVDIMPKQVALELRVMELSKEDALKFGLNWDLTTGGSVQSLGSSQALPEGRSITGSIATTKGFGLDVTATLDQIANKDNLIARPNLLALDGRESELFVGDVIRYVEQIQATQNGTTVITGEVPVGVKLSVLPRIGDGFVTMDIRPMVSFLTGFTPIPGGGQLPQTSVRMSQNTVTLKSGETIAIGGLIQDQEIRRLSKVPILGDLPVLGYLFRQEERIRDRREVVFFLTAKEVINSEDRATGASPRHNAAKNSPEILPGSGNPIKN